MTIEFIGLKNSGKNGIKVSLISFIKNKYKSSFSELH